MSDNSTAVVSQEEQLKRQILAQLDALGSSVTTDESLIFQGSKIILPANMEGNLNEVIKFLRNWMTSQEEKHDFTETFPFRAYDGAAAFQRAMMRLFGTAGVGKETKTFFGNIPPRMITIPVSHKDSLQVPWGKIGFSLLDCTFTLGTDWDPARGYCFQIAANAPKKHKAKIEGFFRVLRDELENRSIYRGKAVDAADNPNFLDVFGLRPESVIYDKQVFTDLEANIWTPIRHSQILREQNIPLKRAVLLEGPYGSGKSLAGMLTAQIAVQHGWTYILVKSGDDPYAALRTAKIYAPAVVQIEDLDILSAGKTREEITKLLDALDSVSVKGAEVMCVFTTNFVNEIDKGVLRPGRIDSIIHIGSLDDEGYEKLVKATVQSAQLAADINYAHVAAAFRGLLPAFAVEAIHRASRHSLVRGKGQMTELSTEDLVNAARSVQHQVDLMNDADEAARSRPTIDGIVLNQMEKVINRTMYEGERLVVVNEN